ncbi:MAG: c-type cytochrome [Gemmatimonadota bacterium]|nr:MAG: c-type cytochrome [Gemmatimonadota bacterium]
MIINGSLARLVLVRGTGARLASALVALSLSVPQAAFAQELSELTQNPLGGSRVFGSKGCVKCHAVNGLGATVGPDLGRISQRHSFYDLAATLWNHLPKMGEAMREHDIVRPQMNTRESGDLIAFLFTLDYFDPPGDVERGKRLFVEKSCVVCHQMGVYGGVIGPSLDHLSQYGSPIVVAAAMWNHGPTMEEVMKARGVERPSFSGSELNDLISYLESASAAPLGGPLYVLPGDAERGRVLFREKNCMLCHSVQSVGGRVGPDLAQREHQWGLTEFAAAMWNKAPLMVEALANRGMDIPQLGSGEMADLVAYLYSVQFFAETGDPERGEQLLGSKGCLACHSLGGAGEEKAPDLDEVRGMSSPAEVIASLWSHSALMESAGTDPWPTFSSEEIADVAAFLQGRAQDR